MESLYLFDDDDFLTRAAMLAFYDDPEKWVLVQSEQEHGQEKEQDITNEILLFCKEPKTVREIIDKFNIKG